MRIDALPDGSRGVDVNATITKQAARDFYAAGYRFAVRYVRRSSPHPYDLTAGEVVNILEAGLGLMVVQHVAAPGWIAEHDLGAQYGAIAASECQRIGIPPMVQVWCDLEGVARSVHPDDVAEFCDAWFDEVDGAGYAPGLYVGDSCILSPDRLAALKFRAYWSAYNLNRDAFPSGRGVCMRQSVAKSSDWVRGCDSQTMDVDTIHTDARGGTPTLLMPAEVLDEAAGK